MRSRVVLIFITGRDFGDMVSALAGRKLYASHNGFKGRDIMVRHSSRKDFYVFVFSGAVPGLSREENIEQEQGDELAWDTSHTTVITQQSSTSHPPTPTFPLPSPSLPLPSQPLLHTSTSSTSSTSSTTSSYLIDVRQESRKPRHVSQSGVCGSRNEIRHQYSVRGVDGCHLP